MTLPDKTVRFLQKAGMDEENLRQLETLRKEDGKKKKWYVFCGNSVLKYLKKSMRNSSVWILWTT